MSKLIEKDDIRYYESLEDAKADGFYPVKVSSVIQFYSLGDRKTIITLEHFEPLECQYVIYSPYSKKYFLREYRKYFLEDLFLKKNILTFDEDIPMDTLLKYIKDGNIHILFTTEMIKQQKELLLRVWKKNRTDDGCLGYKDWIRLVEITLEREFYKDRNSSKPDYKTRINGYDKEILNFWKEVKPNK